MDKSLSRISPSLLIVLTAVSVFILTRINVASAFRLVTRIPLVKRKISEKRSQLKQKFKEQTSNARKDLLQFRSLPYESLSLKRVYRLLEEHAKFGQIKWNEGNASGCVYTVDKRLSSLYLHVFEQFEHFNPLHLDVFPGLVKMEADIVKMVSNMYNGDENTVGTVTSGGSESIILAVKTYRDFFKKRYNSSDLQLSAIAPITIHPAFLKACQYFSVKPILIPIDPKSKCVYVNQIDLAITKGTCAIFVSAPNYPYGIMDPVEEVCKLALKHGGIPVHVDACLGSFVVPFLPNLLKCFDFRCPGVTSISCDTHKYGLAPKGTSVILYRNEELLENQIYATCDWPGGLYVTPNISGSRPGFLVAACWATMLFLGKREYESKARALHSACRQLAEQLSKVEGISLMAEPETFVVSATCKHCYAFLDEMQNRGWYLSALQDPPGFHIALTELHLTQGRLDKLVEDAREAIKKIASSKGDEKLSDVAMLYGTNQRLPDRSIVEDISKDYIISLYK